jgi:hypothetical protein
MRALKIFLGIGAAVGISLTVTPVNASLLFASLRPRPSAVTTAGSGPRYYGYRTYNPGYNDRDAYRTPQYNNPDAYPVGSSRWWEEMDRQGRGGGGGGGR